MLCIHHSKQYEFLTQINILCCAPWNIAIPTNMCFLTVTLHAVHHWIFFHSNKYDFSNINIPCFALLIYIFHLTNMCFLTAIMLANMKYWLPSKNEKYLSLCTVKYCQSNTYMFSWTNITCCALLNIKSNKYGVSYTNNPCICINLTTICAF